MDMPSRSIILDRIEWIILHFIDQLTRNEKTLRLRSSLDPSSHQLIFNRRTSNKLSYNMKTLAQIYQLLLCDKRSTIRDLYYDHKSLYRKQETLNRSVTDVCELLNAQRRELNLLSSSKGLIFGSLSFILTSSIDSVPIDCTRQPLLISENLLIATPSSNSQFILVVEKDATFQKLIDDHFHILYPQSILVTGKGYPDLVTRHLLRRLSRLLSIPIFGLFDADPHGIEIFLTYKYGSDKSKVEGSGANVPTMRWLGLRPSEARLLPLAHDQLLTLEHSDYRKAVKVRRRAEILNEREVVKEMDELRNVRYKMELEAVSSAGVSFLPRFYLVPRLKHLLQS